MGEVSKADRRDVFWTGSRGDVVWLCAFVRFAIFFAVELEGLEAVVNVIVYESVRLQRRVHRSRCGRK